MLAEYRARWEKALDEALDRYVEESTPVAEILYDVRKKYDVALGSHSFDYHRRKRGISKHRVGQRASPAMDKILGDQELRREFILAAESGRSPILIADSFEISRSTYYRILDALAEEGDMVDPMRPFGIGDGSELPEDLQQRVIRLQVQEGIKQVIPEDYEFKAPNSPWLGLRAGAVAVKGELHDAYTEEWQAIARMLEGMGIDPPAYVEDPWAVGTLSLSDGWSDEEMLEALYKHAEELGRRPTAATIDMDENIPDADEYKKRFGALTEAYKQADVLDWERSDEYAKEDLVRLLKEHCEGMARYPSARTIRKDPKIPCVLTYIRHFGSLEEAYKAADVNR